MKRIISLTLCLVFTFSFMSCNKKTDDASSDNSYKIALITTNETKTQNCNFNNVHDACKQYDTENSQKFRNYIPNDFKNTSIVASIDNAILDGFNVLTFIGDEYIGAVSSVATQNHGIVFIIFCASAEIALHSNIYCCPAGEDYYKFICSVLG